MGGVGGRVYRRAGRPVSPDRRVSSSPVVDPSRLCGRARAPSTRTCARIVGRPSRPRGPWCRGTAGHGRGPPRPSTNRVPPSSALPGDGVRRVCCESGRARDIDKPTRYRRVRVYLRLGFTIGSKHRLCDHTLLEGKRIFSKLFSNAKKPKVNIFPCSKCLVHLDESSRLFVNVENRILIEI